MEVNKLMSDINAIEKSISKQHGTDIKTKYKVFTLFKGVKDAVSYRIPMSPINVSEDGHEFTCPKCKTNFVTETDEQTVADFDLCYSCGQLFKSLEEGEK